MRIFSRSVGGLIIALFVVAGSQMVVHSLSSDQRCLVAGWGVVGNNAASLAQLKHVGGGKMVHFGGFWGELGCWDSFRGCPDGSPGVFHPSRAMVRGPERGRAGGLAIINRYIIDDMAGHVDT
jgi:hypothetical protein